MVRLRIVSWDLSQAWTSLSGHHPHDLERRLVRYTGRSRGEVKQLVRQIKERECIDVLLNTDRFAAESFRSFVESLGAAASIEDS
jgi:hypothetical protein